MYDYFRPPHDAIVLFYDFEACEYGVTLTDRNYDKVQLRNARSFAPLRTVKKLNTFNEGLHCDNKQIFEVPFKGLAREALERGGG